MSAAKARGQATLVLTCGGTFDKNRFTRSGKFVCGPTAVPAMLEAARCEHVVVREVLRKDSLDMDDADRAKVVASARRARQEQVVVVHGTDTLVATALALRAARLPKTIVVVGACAPAIFTGSDAAFNLGFALACAQTRPKGVWVAMHATCFAAHRVLKNAARQRFEGKN